MPNGGAPHQSILKNQLLVANRQNHRRHHKLSVKELENQIKAAEHAQALWSNNHYAGVVYSIKCTSRATLGYDGSTVTPCDECMKLLHLKVFRNALRRLPPKKGNWKFTPKRYRNQLLGEAYMRHTDVQEFMEKVCCPIFFCCRGLILTTFELQDDGSVRWRTFAERGIAGRYADQSAFLGMLDAIMKVEDRKFRGKSLKNMKYDAHFDLICTNLALVSPRAYKIMRSEFAGRNLRSMR